MSNSIKQNSKLRTPLGKYVFLDLRQQTHIQATPNLNIT